MLSVVLPVHRLRQRIGVTLRALEQQTLDASRFELIFVDDASPDGTADAIEASPTRLQRRVIRNAINQGRSITRNRGIDVARGDVVVFLDGDMIPHPDLLRTYEARFAAGDCDVVSGHRRCIDLSGLPAQDAGAVAGLIGRAVDRLFDDAHADYAALREHSVIGQLPIALQSRVELAVEEVCRDYPRSLTRALAVITSNVAVRRDVLATTQGFFPGLARFEDTDMGLQLALRGARFVYDRAAEAIHPYDFVNATDRQHEDGFATLLARHPYIPVVLWWCWAVAADEQPSLVDIARAEGDGSLRELDWEELARRRGLTLHAYTDVTEAALRRYWTSVFGVAPAAAESYVRRAVNAHVLHRRRGDELCFDAAAITSWIADHTDFRQHQHRRSLFARRGPHTGEPRAIRWSGRYEVEVPAELVREPGAVVNLAIPIATRYQRDVELSAWSPPELARHIRDGVIAGCPIGGGATIRIGYTLRCTVDPFRPAADDDGDRDVWLRPLSFDEQPELARILQRIDPRPDDDAFTRAYAIYRWMLDTTEHRANALHPLMAARTGLGHCIQLTRLFVALCRRAELPARERCGALVDRLSAPPFGGAARLGNAEACERARDGGDYAAEAAEMFSPFAHTWAEVLCPEGGWTPFEMLPIAHGARVVTPWNFDDRAERRRVIQEGATWDAFYAGGLDALRIHASPWASELPTLARRVDGRWRAVPDPTLAVRHRLRLDGEPR